MSEELSLCWILCDCDCHPDVHRHQPLLKKGLGPPEADVIKGFRERIIPADDEQQAAWFAWLPKK